MYISPYTVKTSAQLSILERIRRLYSPTVENLKKLVVADKKLPSVSSYENKVIYLILYRSIARKNDGGNADVK